MKLRSTIHLYSSVLFAVLLILMNLFIYAVFSRMSLDSQLGQASAETARIAAAMRKSRSWGNGTGAAPGLCAGGGNAAAARCGW
ncbi:hypothetical protein ACFSQ7_45555 [Paenibacillus rhizoplanae]